MPGDAPLDHAADLLDQARRLRERAQDLVSEAFVIIAESRRLWAGVGPRPPDDWPAGRPER